MTEKRWVWVAVLCLVVVQIAQTVYVVHRESLTFDEGNHMFAGYMMWHTGDYGLNPEHPPLVKLLATLPETRRDLWVPKLEDRNFKTEAYMDGRDWLARNDGSTQHMVFEMRLMAGLLAVGLSLMVFFAARAWFGTATGLIALVLVTFDPTVVGHSALVTTDVGVSLFFLASIFMFYRFVKQPSIARLVVAGVAAGLLLATKHSGVLFAPMLFCLVVWETAFAPKGERGRVALRLSGAVAAIVVIGVAVLWAFYGFRYSSRPAGLAINPTLESYVEPLSHFSASAVMAIAHMHLLPESYLVGLVDVKRMAGFYPVFILGKQLAHGVWWYFPVLLTIKTTLGLLASIVIALAAIAMRKLRGARELAFLLIPMAVYLGIAMTSGMNIGARHMLPVYTLAMILAGAGVVAMSRYSRKWAWVCGVLVAFHVVSALTVFPNYIAYANEAWGGPKNVHNLLSDANADWAQQLIQVKKWQDRNPNEECWFAYFAHPEVNPEVYGIRCHHLPTLDTFWLGGADIIPPVVTGNVLISAGDLSACEWPSGRMSPYGAFQSMKPTEVIDYGVMVYHGTFDMKQAAALSRAINAFQLLWKGDAKGALPLAREAVAIDPTEIMSQTALGDSAAALGQKDEARKAWQAALVEAKKLEPDAQLSYVPDLEGKLKKL